MGGAPPICCSSLKTAAVVVAIVEVFLCILAVFGLCRNLQMEGSSYLFWFIIGIVSILILFLAIGLMLYAIKTNQPRWLFPHLSAQFFLIIFLIVVAFVVALLLLFRAYDGIRNLIGARKNRGTDEAMLTSGIFLIIIHLLVAFLEIFFLYIIYKLYKHMKAYAKMGRENEGMAWHGALPKDNAHGSPEMGEVYIYGQEKATGPPNHNDNYGNEGYGGNYDSREFGGSNRYQNQQSQPLIQSSHGYDRHY